MKETKRLRQEKPYADLKQAVKKSREHTSDWVVKSNGMSLYVMNHYNGERNCICLTREAHIEHPYEMESGQLIYEPDKKRTRSERLLNAIDGLTTIFNVSKVPHVLTAVAENTFGKNPHEEDVVNLLKKRFGFYGYDRGSYGYCFEVIASSKTVKNNLEQLKNKKIGEKTVYKRLQERVEREMERKWHRRKNKGE